MKLKNKKNIFIIFTITLTILLFVIYKIVAITIINSEQDNIQIPILMYHYIAPYGTNITNKHDSFMISADQFEKQMKYLYDNKYDAISIDELLCWKEKKCKINKKSVVITFDDGFSSTYFVAEPILEKYNFTATLFIINNNTVEITPSYEDNHYAYVGYDMINNYKRDIIDIGSHTYNMHTQKNNKSIALSSTYDKLYSDFIESRKLLNCDYISYPYGGYNKNVISAAKKAGYKAAFTVNSKMTYRNENNYSISRIGVIEDYKYFKEIFETNKHINISGILDL